MANQGTCIPFHQECRRASPPTPTIVFNPLITIMASDISAYRLFTIIIPTWNRCALLKRNLESILPCLEPFKDRARVFVSDNASDDGTRQFVEGLLGRYADILCYQRQKENIGATPNFIDAVEKANSKYVQLLGDDDMLTHDFLSVLFSLLEQYKDVNLYHFNVVTVSESSQRFVGLRNMAFTPEMVRYYPDFGDFVKEHLKVPGLMSSNVFLRKDFINAAKEDNPEDYPGDFWLNKLYKSCIGKQAVYYSFPLLIQFIPDEPRWSVDWPWYYIYGLGRLFKELDASCPGVYSAWQDFYKSDDNIKEQFLDIISHNRSRYKPRYEKLAEYTDSPRYQQLLRMFISYPTWMTRTWVVMRKLGEFCGYLKHKF